MVTHNFEMDIDMPVLSGAGFQRVVKATQQAARPLARKRILTPARRKFPRNRGNLRKGFRMPRAGAARSRRYFVAYWFRAEFYGPLVNNGREWRMFRQLILDNYEEIILESLAEALQEEGFRP